MKNKIYKGGAQDDFNILIEDLHYLVRGMRDIRGPNFISPDRIEELLRALLEQQNSKNITELKIALEVFTEEEYNFSAKVEELMNILDDLLDKYDETGVASSGIDAEPVDRELPQINDLDQYLEDEMIDDQGFGRGVRRKSKHKKTKRRKSKAKRKTKAKKKAKAKRKTKAKKKAKRRKTKRK